MEGCGDEQRQGQVVELMRNVECAAAEVVVGMVVADVFLVFADVADDVAVHDLHMINVEQQLEVRRANLLDGLDAKTEIVALIAGVALHRMAAGHRVEQLEAERDAVFFGVADDLFGRGGGGLGVLSTSPGVGSLLASAFISGRGGRMSRAVLERRAILLYGAGLLVVASSSWLGVGMFGYQIGRASCRERV